MKLGTNWMQEIERELSVATFVLFFISSKSVEVDWSLPEFQSALRRHVSDKGGAIILPVLLQGAEVPPPLRQFHCVDLRDGDMEKGVGVLVAQIRRLAPSYTLIRAGRQLLQAILRYINATRQRSAGQESPVTDTKENLGPER